MAKVTVSAENLIDRIDTSIQTLTWTPQMAFNYFRMALHSYAKTWLHLIWDTDDGFQESRDFIKPLFKMRFGKKMDVAKIGMALNNLKLDPNDHVSQFAAKMNNNFSQLREIIPGGKLSTYPQLRQTERIQSAKEFITTWSGTRIFNTSSTSLSPAYPKQLCNL